MNSPGHDPATGPWHLDKRIPVALILAIAAQTGGGIWWASGINERVATLERDNNYSKRDGERLAVLESQMTDIKLILQRIETSLSSRDPHP